MMVVLVFVCILALAALAGFLVEEIDHRICERRANEGIGCGVPECLVCMRDD